MSRKDNPYHFKYIWQCQELEKQEVELQKF